MFSLCRGIYQRVNCQMGQGDPQVCNWIQICGIYGSEARAHWGGYRNYSAPDLRCTGTLNFLAAFADDQAALAAPLAISKLGVRPSILEYMDQWTIDCLQKYVGEEVFTRGTTQTNVTD